MCLLTMWMSLDGYAKKKIATENDFESIERIFRYTSVRHTSSARRIVRIFWVRWSLEIAFGTVASGCVCARQQSSSSHAIKQTNKRTKGNAFADGHYVQQRTPPVLEAYVNLADHRTPRLLECLDFVLVLSWETVFATKCDLFFFFISLAGFHFLSLVRWQFYAFGSHICLIHPARLFLDILKQMTRCFPLL